MVTYWMESVKGTTAERNEGIKLCRPPKLSFSSCVDSIKESIKKLSGFKDAHHVNVDGGKTVEAESRRPGNGELAVGDVALPAHPLHQSQRPTHRATVHGGQILGVKRKRARGGGGGRGGRALEGDGSRTSFEVFLSTIPKLDPVDRTVGWVFTQTDQEMQELHDSYTHLPQRGSIAPYSAHPDPSTPARLTESRGYVTSVSRCESDRGTGGRGTPPTREAGQPRLDEVFRQLQLQHEHKARNQLTRLVAPPITYHNLLNLDVHGSQVPGYPAGITYELLPFLSYQRRVPAALIHKNSSYYNQGTLPPEINPPSQQAVPPSLDYVCEWQSCRMHFLTAKELLGHVEEEHVGRLPVRVSGFRRKGQSNTLACQWRGCTESGRVFAVRYKLLLHVQQLHCRDRGAQQRNANKTTSRPQSVESDPKAPPPTAPKAPRYKSTDSASVRARKPPTRTSINNRSHGRKVHPPPQAIPELLIEAHPAIAKRRHKPSHSHQQSMEYTYRTDKAPER